MVKFPYPRTDLSHDLCDGHAERSEAVHHGDPDLDLRDLTIEVPRGQTLARQFRFADLRFTPAPGFDAASAVVAFGAALEPMAGWPLTIVARWSDRSVLMRAGLRFVRSPPPCRASTAWRFSGVG